MRRTAGGAVRCCRADPSPSWGYLAYRRLPYRGGRLRAPGRHGRHLAAQRPRLLIEGACGGGDGSRKGSAPPHSGGHRRAHAESVPPRADVLEVAGGGAPRDARDPSASHPRRLPRLWLAVRRAVRPPWIRQTVRVEQRAIRTLRPLWAPTPPCPRGGEPRRRGGYGAGTARRQPPGHEPCGIRRFLREAVVFDDYAIHEGWSSPRGPSACAIARRPALNCRSNWHAWRAAIRPRCSPLSAPMGYWAMPQVAAAVGHGAHSHAPGDPPAWIWAQAETVALCLLLTYGLQAGDDAALAARLTRPAPAAAAHRPAATADRPSGLGSAPGPHLLAVAAAQLGGLADVCLAHSTRSPEYPSQGDPPQFVERGSTDHPGCQFQALIAMVHWHLLQVATRGVVQRCAEASCRAFFVQTRRTQRFCPGGGRRETASVRSAPGAGGESSGHEGRASPKSLCRPRLP